MICDGSAIKIDMKAFVPASSMKQFSNMKMTGDAKYLAYPLNLSVGQSLTTGRLLLISVITGNPCRKCRWILLTGRLRRLKVLPPMLEVLIATRSPMMLP